MKLKLHESYYDFQTSKGYDLSIIDREKGKCEILLRKGFVVYTSIDMIKYTYNNINSVLTLFNKLYNIELELITR